MKSKLVLPKIISDGMVLQRRKRIHIWGWDEAGANIEVRLDNHVSSGVANERGRFDVFLPARESGGPYELTVSDDKGNAITVTDVMVGLVWFCTGQSNMELPIARVKDRYPTLAQIEENPGIRTFKIIEDTDFHGPLEELRSGSWSRVCKETIMDFSATGYFFAAYLQMITGEAVGFINASLGGSKISSWMSRDMLEGYDELLAEADRYADDDFRQSQAAKNEINATLWREALDKQDRGLSENWKRPELDDKNWDEIDIPFLFKDTKLGDMCGSVWFRRSFDLSDKLAGKSARLFLGTLVDRDEVFVNGVKVGGIEYQYPPRKYDIPEDLTKAKGNSIVIRLCVENGLGRITPGKDYMIFNDEAKVRLDGNWKYKVAARCDSIPPTDFINWHPTGLYNAMTAPCHNYPIDGVLWYQGESNTFEPWDYVDLSKRMIKGYRDKWGDENLPYILAQLPNFVIDVAPVDDPWPQFRLSQSALLQDPMVGMTVNMDLGEDNDLHPTGKRRIGKRLALWAAHLRYGYPSEYCGPTAVSAKIIGTEDGADKEEGRIEISFDHAAGLVARDIGKGSRISDFKIVDETGKEYDADAKIVGSSVILRTDLPADRIKKVRYLVDYTYHGAMLYNKANLPMGPFEICV
ncbi:sialate O-acetylesterase [Butyrivibrio sp. FCS014]|uniref:sialate O-acetylesterase n=1 Tax=Butyrivibrio sp. FCS014 TaxID=1408304 RepID=UPI000466C9BD|nr:sialate O-acetylesterase [Butyrivibrio sp. FCS014]